MVGRVTFNAIAASAQSAATTLAGLLYFGFLLRSLGPEALGGWLAWLSLGMVACLADLGLREALVRGTAVAMASNDRGLAGALLDTTALTVAVSMAVSLVLLMAVLPRFVDLGAAARTADGSLIAGVACMIWLQRVVDVYAAALEGLQRYATVARNNVMAAAVGLTTVLLATPHMGVHAASVGLTVQYACAGAGNLLALQSSYPEHPWWPRAWSWRLCKRGLGYGMSVQAAVGSFILIESIVKLALSHINALALLSFFDLAFRVGRGTRNLLAAGNRVLVPRLAHVHTMIGSTGSAVAGNAASAELESVYLRSFSVMLFLSLPSFVLAAASAGLISLLTRLTVDPSLVDMFFLTLPLWFVFSLADPAINMQMATGDLRPMLWAHGSMLVLLVAAMLGGQAVAGSRPETAQWRGFAIVEAASVAIMLPCLWMIWWHHRKSGTPIASLQPRRALAAIALGIFAAWLPTLFPNDLSGRLSGLVVAGLITLAALRLLPAWTSAAGLAARVMRRWPAIG